ncbi:MAG TPA: hypothetical protein VNO86_12465, partial [Candidatus Binatia bacterium]|nr:hypothetical protein [Candidatus Binatia bacterium]
MSSPRRVLVGRSSGPLRRPPATGAPGGRIEAPAISERRPEAGVAPAGSPSTGRRRAPAEERAERIA